MAFVVSGLGIGSLSSGGFKGSVVGGRKRVMPASVSMMAWEFPKLPNPFKKDDGDMDVDALLKYEQNMKRKSVSSNQGEKVKNPFEKGGDSVQSSFASTEDKPPSTRPNIRAQKMVDPGAMYMELMPGDPGYQPPQPVSQKAESASPSMKPADTAAPSAPVARKVQIKVPEPKPAPVIEDITPPSQPAPAVQTPEAPETVAEEETTASEPEQTGGVDYSLLPDYLRPLPDEGDKKNAWK
mmetsp:Transcript_620/g.1265  ORF Transcript_620/g.1265 Transcript_620/m.1265 type:complete len:239 (-) Transcript_620:1461-2177(-)